MTFAKRTHTNNMVFLTTSFRVHLSWQGRIRLAVFERLCKIELPIWMFFSESNLYSILLQHTHMTILMS